MGENRPSRVKADITINLTVNDAVKREWEGVFASLCAESITTFTLIAYQQSWITLGYIP